MTEEALDELRSLTDGVYPSLLADRGLGDALRAAARRSPIAVELRADGLPRDARRASSESGDAYGAAR